MPSQRETALVSLRNHVLVFHSDTLHVYSDTLQLVETCPAIHFPLHSVELLAVNQNLLLSFPSPSTIAIHNFDLDEKFGTLLPPSLVAQWSIPERHKISVACWAYSQGPESPVKEYALLGTRDGAILRLNLQARDKLEPIYINKSPSSAVQSATISSIAATPCGNGIYAVGYASGPIIIYQYEENEGLKTLQSIAVSSKVLTLSWHYSSRNMASQSLAILVEGSDRLQVWTVDANIGGPAPRKIRDIPLPAGNSVPSMCPKFLQWSKGGKIIRVSDLGLIASDVRTKQVISLSINVPPPVVSLAVKSSKGKAWVMDGHNGLSCYNLMDGTLQAHINLPFLVLRESTTIFDSPVVFLHRPTHVNKIIYKNKRALKGSFAESSLHEDNDNIKSPNQGDSSQFPSPLNIVSRFEEPLSPKMILTTHNPSSQISTLPIKDTTNSLFPSVLNSLSHLPSQHLVPEFLPSMMFQDQYVISALFGGVFDTSLCLEGINNILQYSIINNPNSFKSLIFSLFLNDMSLSQLISTLNKFPGEKKYSDRLVVTLLSIGSIGSNLRDSTTTAGSEGSTDSTRFCNKSLVGVVQNLLQSSEENSADNIHLVCSYLVSMGYYLEARQIYINLSYFLEATVVSLLCKAELASVLKKWCMYLRSAEQNPHLLNYLTDIYTNITVVNRESSMSNSSSFDESSFDELQGFRQVISSSSSPSNFGQLRITEIPAPSAIDNVTIFSPEGVPEDYSGLPSRAFGRGTPGVISRPQTSPGNHHVPAPSTSLSNTSKNIPPMAQTHRFVPHHKYTSTVSSNSSSLSSSSRHAFIFQ